MTAPTLIVEVAFVADPYGTLTWTDVTDKVVRIDFQRGRNYELGKTEAGTLSATLQNWTGDFDPTNTGSTYYPYVLPYRPIRVRATWLTVTYDLWRGYVERWPQKWSSDGAHGTVEITAVDGFKTVLARKFGLRYYEQVLVDLPTWFFRYATGARTSNSTASAVTTSDQSNDTANIYVSFPGLVGPSGADEAIRVEWRFGASSRGDGNPPASTPTYIDNSTGGGRANGSTVVEEVWWRPASIPTTAGQYVRILGKFRNTGTGATGTELMVEARFEPAGAYYQIRYWPSGATGAGTVVAASTAVIPTAGRWDHIALRQVKISTTSKDVQLIVNGVTILSTNINPNYAGYPSSTGVLNGAYDAPLAYENDYAEWATYTSGDGGNTSVAAIEHRANYQSRYAEFGEEDTGTRIDNVLDAVGWPAAMRTIATGDSTVQATGSLAGTAALTVLQNAAEAELGNVFIDGAGQFVFQNRSTRNSPSSAATFGDGGGEYPYQGDITVEFDDQNIFNEVSITQEGSSPAVVVTVRDDVSINGSPGVSGGYGLRSLPRTVALADTADVEGQADTLLAWYKDPRPRLPQITLAGQGNTGNFVQMLVREIGDLVTVNRRPTGAAAISLDCFIDGIKHTITPSWWATTFMLTPLYPDATY